jgi:drug/metabolite transporter (DMT)-like permease
MTISNEANQIIDKLAKVLGSTSSEIVEAYSNAIYWQGAIRLFIGVVFLTAMIFSTSKIIQIAKLPAEEVKKKEDENRVKLIIFTLLGAIGFIASPFLIYHGFKNIMAPKAHAIIMLMEQLTGCY